VALDAYGTVLNFTEPDFIVAMAEICARQGLEADAADIWKRFLRASYLMRSEHHHDPVYRPYVDAWKLQFEHVFKHTRLRGDAQAAALQFREALAAAPAFEDARPAIEALRERFPVALLSNADDDFLGEAIRRNELEFDYVLSSEQAQAIKPNREIFDKLAGMMKTPNEQVLYAGDNPIPDVLGPVNAGMQSAWVNRFRLRKPRGVPQPHVRVRDLIELAELLAPGSISEKAHA
jgi:2-haloalkanoic acid dehalogenase type II